MAKTDHVIWDCAGPRPQLVVPPEHQLVLQCLHCGGKYVLPLPLSIKVTVAFSKAWTSEHARCRKPKEPKA